LIVLGEWYHRVGAMAAGWLCLSAALTNTESFIYGGFYNIEFDFWTYL
jgi:hypothetical protein